jgi:hypothetical protein
MGEKKPNLINFKSRSRCDENQILFVIYNCSIVLCVCDVSIKEDVKINAYIKISLILLETVKIFSQQLFKYIISQFEYAIIIIIL